VKFLIKKHLINILAAVLLTALIITIVPKEQFSEFSLEIVNIITNSDDEKRYFIDIDGNGKAENIKYSRNDKLGRVWQIQKLNTFIDNYNMPNGEIAVSKDMTAFDHNQNGLLEFYFISANNSVAYLNIIEYDNLKTPLLQIHKILLDSVEVFNQLPDVGNHIVNHTGNGQAVFSLYAGYSIQPRRVYMYNIRTGKLKKSPLSSIPMTDIIPTNHDSKLFITPVSTHASGNTISKSTLHKYSISTNIDTIELYNKYKDKAYEYGDFSAYTMLFDQKLQYVFPPIENKGFTSYTYLDYISINKNLHLVTLNYKHNDPTNNNMLSILNLDGDIIYSTILSARRWLILNHPEKDRVYLQNTNQLIVYDDELNLTKQLSLKEGGHFIGFRDLNDDGNHELLALNNNELTIWNSKLSSSISIPLDVRNAGQASIHVFETYRQAGETYLNLQLDRNTLIVKYSHNPLYYFKYPFILLAFGFWFLLLWSAMYFNSKRLKAENIKLEKTVKERTIDLDNKNQLLHEQTHELNKRAEELCLANEHLHELGTFKEMMTNTVIHDLKTPLSTILHVSENEKISQSAENMLNLVLNILDIQKFENNKLSLNKQDIPLSEITAEAISKVKVMMETRNLRIIEHHKGDLSLVADRELMVRVFVNLLNNAIKFSPKNGQITLTATHDGHNSIIVKLTDQGPGIPKDKLASIFNMFEQARIRNFGSSMSSGMGLTFCKVAVEAHAGSIEADNTEEGGALFTLHLPGTILKGQSRTEKKEAPGHEIIFTPAEWLLIKPLVDTLKTLKVFRASEVLSVLKGLDTDNKNISLWSANIKKAVFSGNQLWYNELLDINPDNDNEY